MADHHQAVDDMISYLKMILAKETTVMTAVEQMKKHFENNSKDVHLINVGEPKQRELPKTLDEQIRNGRADAAFVKTYNEFFIETKELIVSCEKPRKGRETHVPLVERFTQLMASQPRVLESHPKVLDNNAHVRYLQRQLDIVMRMKPEKS